VIPVPRNRSSMDSVTSTLSIGRSLSRSARNFGTSLEGQDNKIHQGRRRRQPTGAGKGKESRTRVPNKPAPSSLPSLFPENSQAAGLTGTSSIVSSYQELLFSVEEGPWALTEGQRKVVEYSKKKRLGKLTPPKNRKGKKVANRFAELRGTCPSQLI